MTLVNDATCSNSPRIPPMSFSKGRINEEQLKEMVKQTDIWEDIDKFDVISIIFLFTDTETDIIKLIEDLNDDPVQKFLKLYLENNWSEKLLEALIITENFNIIKKLCYNDSEIEEMKIKYSHREHTVSVNLNTVIKSLYFLCKELSKENFEKLIVKVNEELRLKLDLNFVEPLLEIHILHWIKQKYITIEPNAPTLHNLLKNLKKIGCLYELPFNFDYWKTEAITKSSQDSEVQDQPMNYYPSFTSQTSNSGAINTGTKWDKEHKRLCIIINEVDYMDKNKRREGSDRDKENLEEAFSGCGFEIKNYRNVKKKEMMDILASFGDKKKNYKNYGSIFLCILSHGSKDQIMLSDQNTISIDEIKENFCCQHLQNVFKFVILQCCQGTREGLVEKKREKLVADGSWNSHVFINFAIFLATVSNFVAWRHEDEGSWFITDICAVLKEENRKDLSIPELVQKVTDRVTQRRDEKEDMKNIERIQTPCLKEYVMTTEYYIPTFKKRTAKLLQSKVQ